MLLTLIMICSAGFILLKGKDKTKNQTHNNSPKITKKQTVEIGKKSNVKFQENKYYKKYSIELKKDMKDIKWSEDSSNINVEVDSQSIDKLVVSSENKKIVGGISFGNGESNKIIKISKTFKENYVYQDLSNKKVINVIISKLEKPYDYKVVVDPGHGGFDPGTNLKGLLEKDVVLKIAKSTEQYLTYNGCKVVMTRNKDVAINGSKNEKQDLRARCDIISKENPDASISIHINSFKDSKYGGLTTYYFAPNGYQKQERIQMANMIQKEVVKDDGWKDRGILSNKYALTNVPKAPCVIIECGFITNEEDRARMLKPEALDNLAKNISSGMINFLNSQKH